MSEDIAKLGIAIDATQVTPAASKLDDLAAAGGRAETQTNQVTASAKQLATALAATNGDLAKATALLAAQADAATATATATAKVAASATASASEQVAAAEATAAAATESAAVQIAANEAVVASHKGSSQKIRESLVLLREASVGNYTRMAGSASILLGAFGLLEAVLGPLAVGAIALGGAVELATNQINSGAQGSGDLTRNLNLTAEQLEKVKDRYVSFGDTIKAVFIVLKNEFTGTGISEAWQGLWNGIASFAYNSLIYVTGAVQGAVDVIAKSVTIAGQLIKGQFGEAGKTASKAFADGFAQNKKDIDAALDNVANVARQLAVNKILKEAGNAPKEHEDHAVTGAEDQIRKLEDETAAQKALNDQVNSGTLTVNKMIEAQQLYAQTASTIARIEQDAKLTQTQKADLIARLISAQKGYNQTKIDEKAIEDQFNLGNQIQLLQTQLSLISATTKQRAISVATLRAEQEADKAHMDPADREIYIGQQKTIAELTVQLAHDQQSYNDKLALQAKLMQEVARTAETYANGLADAFGNVGRAIGDMSTSLSRYAAQQANFAQQQQQINLLNADDADTKAKQLELDQRRSDATSELYANEISGVKNLFDSKSGVYKALNAIEGAYNAIMLANSIARTVASLTETTTKVSGAAVTSAATVAATGVETASTGVSVANAAAQSSAWGVTAVVKAIASLPFPLDLIAGATVLAAIVGLGVAISGGLGGGGAQKQDTTAKDEQAAQGAGSVLGDAASKSDSIAKSLDTLTKNTNSDLDYSSQMVTSLRSIDTHIGSLTALLARQLQVGGLFDTSGLGLGSSSSGLGSGIPLIGGLVSSLFGSSSSSSTLIDQGIQVAGETIGQAVAQGVQAAAYNTVQTTTKSSALFGLISSSHTNNNTSSTPLGSEFTNNIQDIVSGLRSTVLDAANKLGVDGAQAVVDSLALNIGKISTKDLSGSDIQAALNAVFSELGDQMVEAALPQIKNLQQVGEGALETLSRLVSEYQAVDDAAKTVGFTFSLVGVDSLAARDNLVQLSGGLDNFTKQASFFVDNFETSAQAITPIAKAVNDEMTRLGLSGISTKDQFAQVVQALDTSTVGGAALYTQLMNVAPAFAKVADAVQQLNDNRLDILIKYYQNMGDTLYATNLQREKELEALDASLRPFQALEYASEDLTAAQQNLAKAQNDLVNAQKAANQVTQQTIDKFNGFITSLTSFQDSLASGPLAGNNINRQYLVTRSLFQSTASAAAGGDATAIGNLQSVSSDFLNASLARASNVTDYVRDLAAVKDAVSAALIASHHQVDINTQQLYAIQDVNNSVLSVTDALNNLTAAQLAFNKAEIELATAQQNQAVNVTLNNVIPQPLVNVYLPQTVVNVTPQTIVNVANDNASSVTSSTTSTVTATGGSISTTSDNTGASSTVLSTAGQPDSNVAAIAQQAAAALGSITPTPAPAPTPAQTATNGITQADLNELYAQAQSGDSDPSSLVFNSAYQMLQSLGWPTTPEQYNAAAAARFAELQSYRNNSHAGGLGYVPYDGYRATLHQGEEVLNARDAADHRAGGGKDVVEAIKSLRADFKQLHKNTEDTNRLLRRFTSDGNTLNVKVA